MTQLATGRPRPPPRLTGAAALVALLLGVIGALQTRINGELTLILGDALLAALISCTLGLITAAVILLARGRGRRALWALPGQVHNGRVPVWQLLGWITPAVFLPIVAFVVPRTGVAYFAVAVVAGQVTSSLIVDRVGIGPRGRRPVTVLRVAATIAAVGFAALSASGDVGQAPASESIVLLGLVLGAGLTTGWQQAINGRLAASTGQPFLTSAVNLGPACVFILLLWLAITVAPRGLDTFRQIPWHEPWLLIAGVMSAITFAAASVIVRYVGLLLFGLLGIGGLLLGAVIADVLWPVPGVVVTWQVTVGVLGMLAVAASLALPAVVRLVRYRARARTLRVLGGPPA